MSASAFVQVSCRDFNPSLEFFTSAPLNFLVESIFPADDPSEASLVGQGLKLVLVRDGNMDATTICVQVDDPERGEIQEPRDLKGPNGTLVRLLPPEPLVVACPTLQEAVVVSHLHDDNSSDGVTTWSVGRAGMRYRDLIPCRLGGRYIASHIHIPKGGPVPDYCHYHHIHFQMIFCYKGWVKVVYEGQGEPFVMHPGDCVLQPPRIRHRVLEASDNLEVVEVGSPAVHKTVQDFNMTLPSAEVDVDRVYSGQKFVRHLLSDRESKSESGGGLTDVHGFEAATAVYMWGQAADNGQSQDWKVLDTGIFKATGGVASARVVRALGGRDVPPAPPGALNMSHTHSLDMLLLFVLAGSMTCEVLVSEAQQQHKLVAGSSLVVPAHTPFVVAQWSDDAEVLEIQVFS
mmetsp:Transcript_11853/g.19304  ORF Transcript_11853/g.19304 Transcript_11853/m.19304 type:complete len:403 (+) Transcript_11853:113-1321(+)|eukprot:CAMPEP_0114420988 /NCGR_PEP_ID=MMETSP0103-20121206/4842_1 /TAXON_ID=37642 ORGANISM="Paraphysomonas imperforata, Strain PA2" /NCGR_SAMPLE_ID=MMETSP0103 /ASSEMBLY_ACC=CAM_ASM_000201 /LENGTH=402 /DNA_ID=CAMNT_0001589487 /DNA_START=32 /DNA_END=1240 /DNA_ORIENTATION=+